MAKAAWTGIARQMCDYLQVNEKKITFLRSLDKKIMDEDTDIDSLFAYVLSESTHIIGASRTHLYALAGDTLVLAASTEPDSVPETVMAEGINDKVPEHSSANCLLTRSESGEGVQPFFSGESALIVRILPEQNQSFGLLVFETDHPEQASPFSDEDNVSFAKTIANQMSLAVKFKNAETRRTTIWNILSSFFEEDLKPTRCIKVIAEHFYQFLPDYQPFRLNEKIEVQILFHKSEDNSLIIRASTGHEPDNTRVEVADSVCGLLFEDTSLEYVLCNPTVDYPHRYKAYLGNGAGHDMQTELALPLSREGDRFAVINLESTLPNTFRKPHIDSMQVACKLFSPILHALNLRIERSRTQQYGLMESLSRHLESTVNQYTHKTRAAFTGMRIALEDLVERTDAADTEGQEIYKSLSTHYSTLLEKREWFCSKVPSFAQVGGFPISSLIQESLDLFNWDTLATKQNIQLETKFKGECLVLVSDFLIEVFRNILDNSIYWIQQRQAEEPQHQGKIQVKFDIIAPTDENQEIELNTFCRVVFRDNGPGVSKNALKSIFEPEFSKRPKGIGLGLYVAKEYIAALGGRIEAKSEPGEFFQIEVHLRLQNNNMNEKVEHST